MDEHEPCADEVELDAFGRPWPAGETLAEFFERVGADTGTIPEHRLRRVARIITRHLAR